MTFRITGPGLYVNRRGEKFEINRPALPSSGYSWVSEVHGCFREDGGFWPGIEASDDIVGVWEKPSNVVTLSDNDIACLRQSRGTPTKELVDLMSPSSGKSPNVQITKTSEYNLELVSDRFRALEDGRSLVNDSIYGDNKMYLRDAQDAPDYFVRINHDWSLVPLKRTVTTRKYVSHCNDAPHYLKIDRCSAPPVDSRWTCLGAIKGSEQTEEVEV